VCVEHDWVDVTIIRGDLGDDFCDCIVRSVSFNNNGIIRVEMHQDRSWMKAVLRVSNALMWSGPQMKGMSLHLRDE